MFRRTALLSASALLVAASTLSLAPAQSAQQMERATTTLRAKLAPSGDSNGIGSATITLNPARGRVCAELDWTRIDAPDSAHIHQASDGSVVVDLTSAASDGSGCTKGISRAVIKRIIERPKRYYVNIHNEAYPAGAIQGTLRR